MHPQTNQKPGTEILKMKFNKILYVAESELAQDHAVTRTLALAKTGHAHVTFMDVVTEQPSSVGLFPSGISVKDFLAWKAHEKQVHLETLLKNHATDENIDIKIVTGRKKYLEAIKAVLDHDYDLVIKPVEDPDWVDRLFGSEDMHLLRKCPCPVWLIKESEGETYNNIFAAIDFDVDELDDSPGVLSQQIMRFALNIAVSDNAKLHFVHAWDAPEAKYIRGMASNPEEAEKQVIDGARSRHRSVAQTMMQALKKEVGAEIYEGVSPTLHLPQGEAHTEIPKLAKSYEADLVVMGTVARTGIPGLIIGNTAEAIVDQLNCSLVALKPTDFVSPLEG